MSRKIVQLVIAQPDWFAVYAILEKTDDTAPKYTREPVACWGLVEEDENGPCALVVNEKGYLAPAQDLKGFLGISKPADAQHRTNWQEVALEFVANQAKSDGKQKKAGS